MKKHLSLFLLMAFIGYSVSAQEVTRAKLQDAKPVKHEFGRKLSAEELNAVKPAGEFGDIEIAKKKMLNMLNDENRGAFKKAETTASEVPCDAISTFPWFEGFEDPDDVECWSLYDVDGDGVKWEKVSASNARTGTAAFGHRYARGAQEAWLVSPQINIPATGNIIFNFWSRNQFPSEYGKNSVWISTESNNPESNSFTEVWSPASVTENWVETTISLSDFAGETIYIGFKYEGDYAHSWYIDDLEIIDFSNHIDAGIKDILSPSSGANLTSAETVKVLVRNNGNNDITGFALKLELDDVEIATEIISATVASLTDFEYTFNASVDLSLVTQYNIKVTVDLTDDVDADNDVFEKTVTNFGNIAIMGTDATVTSCDVTFMDDGIDGPYSEGYGDTQTITFFPANTGDKLMAEFTVLNLAPAWILPEDVLYVYKGCTVAEENLLATLEGNMNSNLPTFTSFAANGALTFVFVKNSFSEEDGWEAKISCRTPGEHDLAVAAVSPSFVIEGKTVTPKVMVQNIGKNSESAWSVTITDGGSYSSTKSGSEITVGETVTVTMDDWAPVATSTLTATVTLTGDGDLSNNELAVEVTVGNYEESYAGNIETETYTIVDLATGEQTKINSMPTANFPMSEEFDGEYIYRVYENHEIGIVYPDGVYEKTGTVTGTDNMITGLAYDWYNSVWYAIAVPASGETTLYTLDMNTLALSEIGISSVANYIIAMDMAIDGYLYGPGLDDILYRIDPSTGENIEIGPLGLDINYEQDVTFAGDDMKLYTFTCGGAFKYGYYDLSTGAFQEIADVGLSQRTPFVITTAPSPGFDVTFNVTDGTNPVEGFEIRVGTRILHTNEQGNVKTRFPNGTYEYVAGKFGYETTEGTFTVNNAAQTVDIPISVLPKYTVKFNISNYDNAPLNAKVSLKYTGNVLHEGTAVNGTISFNDVVSESYTYNVTYEGYVSVSDQALTVDANKDMEVKLEDIIFSPYGLEVIPTESEADWLFIWNNDYGKTQISYWQENTSTNGLYQDFNKGYGVIYDLTDYPDAVLSKFDFHHGSWDTYGTWNYILHVVDMNAAQLIYTSDVMHTTGNDVWEKGISLNDIQGLGGKQVGIFLEALSGTNGDAYPCFSSDNITMNFYSYIMDLSTLEATLINTISGGFTEYMMNLWIRTTEGEKAIENGAKSLSGGYTVYLDGEEVASGIQDTQYKFGGLTNGTHTAGVRAVYSSGLSEMATINFTVDGVSIEGINPLSVSVYPNPTTGKLTVENNQDINSISVIDIAGNVLQTWNQVGNHRFDIDLSGYATGVYFIKVDGTINKVIRK